MNTTRFNWWLVNNGLGNRLGAVRQQAITWANTDLDILGHMVSLGYNELMSLILSLSPWWIGLGLGAVRKQAITSANIDLDLLGHTVSLGHNELIHWGRVTHICVTRLTITGSDNGLSPERRQAIIWTNAGILLIGPLGTNFSENLIEILAFSFTKMRLKMSSAKWRPFCLGLNGLMSLILFLPPTVPPYHFTSSPFLMLLPSIPNEV